MISRKMPGLIEPLNGASVKLRLLLAFAVIIIIVAFLFSSKESYWQCDGNFTGQTAKERIYFKLTEWRWWLVLWEMDVSDGRLNIEASRNPKVDRLRILKLGDKYQINDGEHLRGWFSLLSHNISIYGDPAFEGNCTQVER